ncbi:MAG: HEPN domain-containing protein [Nanoarchaeota archaeon]|nr:HEPN domain-containing protein [Nanoarchaeota archaeon]
MSQASNHVKWCLNKAKREIEECKKLDKRPKHRGLLKIEPDIDEDRKHLAKAEHNFNAITRFKETGFSDWSISAGFYCIYQCFLAIAVKFGYESRNQTCTIALMEHLKEEGKIDIDTKFIDMLKYEEMEEIQENKVIDMREDYTYGVEISVEDKTKINDLIKSCKEIIDITKNIVFK